MVGESGEGTLVDPPIFEKILERNEIVLGFFTIEDAAGLVSPPTEGTGEAFPPGQKYQQFTYGIERDRWYRFRARLEISYTPAGGASLIDFDTEDIVLRRWIRIP